MMNKKHFLSLLLLMICWNNPVNAEPTADDLLEQSQMSIREGRVYAAFDLLQQAETASQSAHQRWLIAMAASEAYLRNGQLEKARQKLDTIYPMIESARQPALFSALLQRMGHVAMARQDLSSAGNYYQQALEQAELSDDPAEQAAAWLNLAAVDQQLSSLSKAEQAIQQLAESAEKQRLLLALAYQAEQQGQIAMAYQATQQLLSTTSGARIQSQAYGLMAKLYQRQNRHDEALQLVEKAITSSSDQDLQLQWLWLQAQLLAGQNQTESALAAYRSATQQLNALRVDIPVFYHDGQSSFNQTFAPLYEEYIETLLKASSNQPTKSAQKLLQELIDSWELLKAAELQDYFKDACAVKQNQQQQLEPGTAMLYPIMLADKLLVVARFSDQIIAHTVALNKQQLADRLQNFSADMINQRSVTALSRQLYQWMLAPLQASFKERNIHTLVYLPDGQLRQAPLAMLHDGKQYLIEKYALVTVPGLSMVSGPSEALNKQHILLAGMSVPGPVVDELIDSKTNIFAAVDEAQRGLSLRGAALQPRASDTATKRELRASELREELTLPGVTTEITRLKEMSQGAILQDDQFTLMNFQENVYQGHSVVHIASHGFFSGDPENSFVMTYDRILNMNQLAELFRTEAFNRQPVEMVVLSACQTAEGDDRSPLGLSGVVVQSGVKSAVGSLWPVADEAAQQFFAEFYQAYQQPGISKAKAMRIAQKKLLKQYPHPFFWAPFILVGEWH